MEKPPVVLMLPGMMCDHRLFSSQIARFDQDFEVVVGDLCGGRTITELAQSMIAMMKGRRAHVVGLSMGGIVAMEIAKQARGQVASLALLNTNFKADASWRRPVREHQILAAKEGGALDVVRKEMMPHYFSPRAKGRSDLEELTLAMAERLGDAAFVAQSVALMERDSYGDFLPTLEAPVLALAGSDDIICPPAFHRELVALCKFGRYVELSDCGHLSTIEQPDAVSEALASFIQEIRNGTYHT